jgi:hypothetical protein
MISKKLVAASIDHAGEKIGWCWTVLDNLTRGRGREKIGADVLLFQSKLIDALWALDDRYRSIVQEKSRLVKRKSEYDSAFFARRMQQLDGYLKAVKGAIGTAKSVGDAFAWLFYANDLDLIEKQLACQMQVNLPPGVGRIGERAFVEKFQGINGYFVLYHGISTFLRLGDVSFIDVKKWKVISIGEVKTKKGDGDNQYVLTINFVYGGRFKLPLDLGKIELRKGVVDQLPPMMKDRLKRQTIAIGRAISADRNTEQKQIGLTGAYYFDELSALLSECNSNQFSYKTAGKSLLLVAIRLRERKLSARMLTSKRQEFETKLNGVTEQVKAILDENLSDNALFLSPLGYNTKGFPIVLRGSLPMPLWPLSHAHLDDLVFGRVIVLTLHNPAHFWQMLREKGYVVTTDDKSKLVRATKKIGKKIVRLENMDYFRLLTELFLMDEKTIVGLLEQSIGLSGQYTTDSNVRINLAPQMMIPGFGKRSEMRAASIQDEGEE